MASQISSRTLSVSPSNKKGSGENPINTLSVCRWKPLIKDRNLNKVQVKRGSTTRSSGVRQLVDVASLFIYRHVPHYISFIHMKGAMLHSCQPCVTDTSIFLNTLPINQRRIGRAYERILPVYFHGVKATICQRQEKHLPSAATQL